MMDIMIEGDDEGDIIFDSQIVKIDDKDELYKLMEREELAREGRCVLVLFIFQTNQDSIISE